jgi:CheY-like chemotaxis protein
MLNKRILIIDDEPSIRDIVHLCLHELGGYDVIEAGSGQEGLHKAVNEHPDAIVLDMCMPQMDGMEVLRQLQACQATQTIPVVMLSAIASLVNPYYMATQGVVKTISKPFDPLTLSGQVAAASHWTTIDYSSQSSA